VNELEATITLEYDDEEVAEAVARAVSPDNFKTPNDLAVVTSRNSKLVTTEIRTEGKMATFIATIDDLLFYVSVAEKALKAVREG
jgi:tRNA threonylcarbamoyladenosine modification (KEOPS) complex  Pcc1 subunit